MSDDTVRGWMVERTYAEDIQNLIVLTYATTDGEHDYRKERALQGLSGAGRETRAGLDVDSENLGDVSDPETRERYAREATRMAENHDPEDAI